MSAFIYKDKFYFLNGIFGKNPGIKNYKPKFVKTHRGLLVLSSFENLKHLQPQNLVRPFQSPALNPEAGFLNRAQVGLFDPAFFVFNGVTQTVSLYEPQGNGQPNPLVSVFCREQIEDIGHIAAFSMSDTLDFLDICLSEESLGVSKFYQGLAKSSMVGSYLKEFMANSTGIPLDTLFSHPYASPSPQPNLDQGFHPLNIPAHQGQYPTQPQGQQHMQPMSQPMNQDPYMYPMYSGPSPLANPYMTQNMQQMNNNVAHLKQGLMNSPYQGQYPRQYPTQPQGQQPGHYPGQMHTPWGPMPMPAMNQDQEPAKQNKGSALLAVDSNNVPKEALATVMNIAETTTKNQPRRSFLVTLLNEGETIEIETNMEGTRHLKKDDVVILNKDKTNYEYQVSWEPYPRHAKPLKSRGEFSHSQPSSAMKQSITHMQTPKGLTSLVDQNNALYNLQTKAPLNQPLVVVKITSHEENEVEVTFDHSGAITSETHEKGNKYIITLQPSLYLLCKELEEKDNFEVIVGHHTVESLRVGTLVTLYGGSYCSPNYNLCHAKS